MPLSPFVRLEETAIPSELKRLGQRCAVQLSAVTVDGMPLQLAVNDLRALAGRELPTGMGLLFRSDAVTLGQTGRDVAITFPLLCLWCSW